MAGSAVQRRGGTSAENATFTGLAREVTVDTTRKTLRVHDGATPGGQILANLADLQLAAPVYGGLATGTAAVMVLTPSPAVTALAVGFQLRFVAGLDSTGAATLNVSGLGAVPVVQRNGSTALFAADFKAGSNYLLSYDGTSWRLNDAASRITNDATGRAAVTTLIASDVQTAAVNGGPLAGFRNRVINGNFAINQVPYLTGVAAVAGGVLHDQWKAGSGGATVTFAAPAPDAVVTITAGTAVQVVESIYVEGGQYILAWTGTATGRIVINGAVLSGAYAASPITTAAATAGQNITMEFGTGTLGLVRLMPGVIDSPFERRPLNIEQTLCERYAQWVPFGMSFTSTGAAQAQHTTLLFRTLMRATPTISASVVDTAATQTLVNVTSTGYVPTASTASYGTEVLVAAAAGTCVALGYRCLATSRL